MGKKNDASFEFQTPNMTESIDLCLVLFAFLFSKKNAFKNSDMALPLTKYRYFFKTLYDLSLLKETRFGWDAKYKDLISAVMYDEEYEALKDESYFFAALEEVVKIHKKDSKKQIIHVLFPLSCLMVLVGVIYFFIICKTWFITKTISPSEIILEVIPSILISAIGIFCSYKCAMSLKVYSHKEKDPVLRTWYHDIDLDYCFNVLNSEMKKIYNEINENKARTSALEEIVNTVNGLSEKASAIEEITNNIGLLIKPKDDSDYLDGMLSGGAPITITPKGLRCSSTINMFVKWIIEENYDEPGRVDWIVENVKDKNGKKMNRETLMQYFRNNREIYRANKNLKKSDKIWTN